MREIKFRGKRIDNNEWVYGDLLQPTELCNIYEISDCNSVDGTRYDIDLSTIGQYTGLKDKNKKEIYEGDIINDCDYGIMICKFINGSFVWQSIKKQLLIKFFNYIPLIEVIGNITDNPELLQEE